MCFCYRIPASKCWGSQPKHVSNLAYNKFEPHFVYDCLSGLPSHHAGARQLRRVLRPTVWQRRKCGTVPVRAVAHGLWVRAGYGQRHYPMDKQLCRVHGFQLAVRDEWRCLVCCYQLVWAVHNGAGIHIFALQLFWPFVSIFTFVL